MTTIDAEAKCPKCGYDLRGLPAAHVCPECGLRYDRLCRVIKLDYSRSKFTEAFLATILLVVYLWGTWMHPPDLNSISSTIPCFALLAVYPISYLIRRFLWSPSWLVINRDGVHLEYRGRPARTVWWSDLRECQLDNRVFRLINKRGQSAMQIDITAFGGSNDPQSIRTEIGRLSQAYADL